VRAGATGHPPRQRWRLVDEDRGAALIVAIGFVLMIGAITAGLSSLVTSSMNNRGLLQAVRDREYAADAVVEDAIVEVRGRIGDGTATCSDTPGSTAAGVNDTPIRVDWRPACTTLVGAEGLVVVQHNVVFSACVDLGAPCADAAVIVRAQVNFQQDHRGEVVRTYVQQWSVLR